MNGQDTNNADKQRQRQGLKRKSTRPRRAPASPYSRHRPTMALVLYKLPKSTKTSSGFLKNQLLFFFFSGTHYSHCCPFRALKQMLQSESSSKKDVLNLHFCSVITSMPTNKNWILLVFDVHLRIRSFERTEDTRSFCIKLQMFPMKSMVPPKLGKLVPVSLHAGHSLTNIFQIKLYCQCFYLEMASRVKQSANASCNRLCQPQWQHCIAITAITKQMQLLHSVIRNDSLRNRVCYEKTFWFASLEIFLKSEKSMMNICVIKITHQVLIGWIGNWTRWKEKLQ